MLSGQNDWKVISLYDQVRLDFLKRCGDFSHGVALTLTIARTMGMISATRLQKCFIEWMNDCCELTKGEVVAIDGKTVRGPTTTLADSAQSTWLTHLPMKMALASDKKCVR